MKSKMVLALLLISFIFTNTAYALPSKTLSYKSIEQAVNALKVAPEDRTGYVRTKFKHWVGVGNGCDSRKTVIISEATVKPVVEKGCVIKGGEWLSVYDSVKVTDAGKLDVDHMVPLAEAWDSGAYAWDDKKRELYANDQTDARHLIAVTGSSNRSKSDRDPAEWIPTNEKYKCQYIMNWVSIKVRWSLSVDEKELLAIKSIKCPKLKITITPL
jgi:hypothetical protein